MNSQTGMAETIDSKSIYTTDDVSMRKMVAMEKIPKSWILHGLIIFIILVVVLVCILYIIKPHGFSGNTYSGFSYFLYILTISVVIVLIIAFIVDSWVRLFLLNRN